MGNVSHQDALERFETIWEHVECGICIVDAETRRILDINPVAARMFGDDKDKIIGQRCHKFICPAEFCSCPIMDKGQTVDRSERVFITAEGKRIPIIKSVAKIRYNGRLALLESFTDISKLKEAELKLREMEVAEQANQAKGAFLSRMSHEMRTPMNAIIGMARIAENTTDVEKLKHCLSTIEVSANHLLGLINDVLDMSKIEAGKLELNEAPLDLEKMMMKICNLVIEQVEQKNIRLSVKFGPGMGMHYIGDELRLSQIVTNLVANAVKFTGVGGEIRIHVEETALQDSSLLTIQVADTGIGMTGVQIEKLFKAFEQADSSISSQFGGTGLGLAISKSLAEKMNGTIRVQSQPEQGSVFTVEVCLKRMPHQEEAGLPAVVCPTALRLLVADSDGENREYLRSIIARFGIGADEAVRGGQAMDLVRSARDRGTPYDVIFIADTLPDIEGIELAGQLKGIARPGSMVLMTSFLNWSGSEQRARESGADRVITLPLFPSKVLDAIVETVGVPVYTPTGAGDHTEEIPDFSNLTLLLAEDVEINREIFLALLEETGVTIEVAENGQVAVEKFAADPDRYDAVIMDVRMPVMDGFAATRAIRTMEHERAHSVPIIAMTANVFREDIEECLQNGMTDHLSKPIDQMVVLEKIRQHCPVPQGKL